MGFLWEEAEGPLHWVLRPSPEGDLYLPSSSPHRRRAPSCSSSCPVWPSSLLVGEGLAGYRAILLMGVLKPSSGKKSEWAAPSGH